MSRRGTARIGLFCAALALAVAGCGGATGEEVATTGGPSAAGDLPLIYGVFATPIEEPWDGAIHAALQSAVDDGLIEYKYVDNVSTADAMERALRDIAANQHPDAIMGDAFAAEEAVRKVAAEFPDIPFAFGSGQEPTKPNMSVFANWLQDPAYLAGMLAGGLTDSKVIGVVGAMPIPEVNRIINAFALGVRQTQPEATVKVSFINTFFDPAAARQAAAAHVAAGADVLFAERDGVIAAAQEADIPVFGMMVDQSEEAPRHVVSSLIWNVRPTVDAVIDQAQNGPRAVDLGKYSFMKVGGSALAPINTDVVGGVPQDLVEAVEKRKQEIMDGSFVTPVDEKPPANSIDVSEL
jgi:basic membrane lipoprotein Med (substrate-binding protein (PBP1-ABC) superfamily)